MDSCPPSIRSPTKGRHFFIRTYLSEEQITVLILSHNIQHWAYILHDKDVFTEGDKEGQLKEPHYHIILSLVNANTVSAVSRWFKGYTDSNGLLIQSHIEVCKDRFNAFDYLTHETQTCIERGDFIYSKSLIKSDSLHFFSGKNRSSEVDVVTECFIRFLNGDSYSYLLSVYGKIFIYNFHKFQELASEMHLKHHFDPNDYFIKSIQDNNKFNLLE